MLFYFIILRGPLEYVAAYQVESAPEFGCILIRLCNGSVALNDVPLILACDSVRGGSSAAAGAGEQEKR